MNASRRYEILLPLRFNDGEVVPDEFVGEALLELQEKFGAVSWETQPIRGSWQQGGKFYHDELMRIFVDVPDQPENRQFFLEYKERMKSKFRQLEIYLTSYLVDVL
jgi:hypothetical protein